MVKDLPVPSLSLACAMPTCPISAASCHEVTNCSNFNQTRYSRGTHPARWPKGRCWRANGAKHTGTAIRIHESVAFYLNAGRIIISNCHYHELAYERHRLHRGLHAGTATCYDGRHCQGRGTASPGHCRVRV